MTEREYFVLACREPMDWDDSALPDGIPPPPGSISWCAGQRFVTPPQEPVQVLLNPTHSDQLLTYYDTDAILMPKRMLDTLRAGGVDNLDAYDAVIRHEGTGFVTEEYVAANLVGLVSAADIAKSKVVGGSSDHRLDTEFEGFSVDEPRARGFLMFRLGENTAAVLVHRSLKDRLQAAGFDQLRFIPPEQWVG
jgi:hypothetical protein